MFSIIAKYLTVPTVYKSMFLSVTRFTVALMFAFAVTFVVSSVCFSTSPYFTVAMLLKVVPSGVLLFTLTSYSL